MMKHGFILAALVALFSLAVERQAVAAPFDFQYGTTVTPSLINPTASVPAQGSIVFQGGVGTFPAPSGAIFNANINGAFGTDITVGTITVVDLGLGAYTDTYGPTTITFNLALKDVASNATGLFTFTGSLTGQVASTGTTLGSAFDNPFSATSQTQSIGGTFYTVRIIPSKAFTAPGTPPAGGSGLPGAYSFNVINGAVPEPASVTLLAFGSLALLVIARRGR